MAVSASPIEVLDRAEWLRLRRVAARDVARVADPRHAHLQQLRVAAAVRLVAVGTVFHNGGMLPQEWTPAFGMTTEAVLVDRALNELAWVRTSVRVVATGAGDLALAIRHVGGTLQLRPPHLVALEAQLRLRFLGAYGLGERRAVTRFRSQRRVTLRWAAIVDFMAVHAGHGSRLVRAASPEHLITLRVAGQASRVFLLDWVNGILGEADRDGILAAARVHVGSPRSVAGFAAARVRR